MEHLINKIISEISRDNTFHKNSLTQLSFFYDWKESHLISRPRRKVINLYYSTLWCVLMDIFVH
jgi:hypothetical protein